MHFNPIKAINVIKHASNNHGIKHGKTENHTKDLERYTGSDTTVGFRGILGAAEATLILAPNLHKIEYPS